MLRNKLFVLLVISSMLVISCRINLVGPMLWSAAHIDLSQPLPEKDIAVGTFLANLDEIGMPEANQECASLIFSGGLIDQMWISTQQAHVVLKMAMEIMTQGKYRKGIPVAVMYSVEPGNPCQNLLSMYELQELMTNGEFVKGQGLIATLKSIELSSSAEQCSLLTVFNTFGSSTLELSQYQAALLMSVLPKIPQGGIDMLIVYEEVPESPCVELRGVYQMVPMYIDEEHMR